MGEKIELIFIFILTIVLTIAVYAWWNRRYTMVTTGGIEGRAQAHFSNLLTILIVCFGISLFLVHGIFKILSSEIFWFILIAIIGLYFFLSKDDKKKLLESLEKNDQYLKQIIYYMPDDKGVEAEAIIFYDTNNYNQNGVNGTYFEFFKEDTKKENISSVSYKHIVFKNENSEDYCYIFEPIKELNFQPEKYDLNKYTSDYINNILTLCKDKNNSSNDIIYLSKHVKFNPNSNAIVALQYNFIKNNILSTTNNEWICPNCGQINNDLFCAKCGQKNIK